VNTIGMLLMKLEKVIAAILPYRPSGPRPRH
jgi:hypothetical protein